MHFIFSVNERQPGIRGQSMVEYVLTFAVIAGLAVFGSKFFTALHDSGGGGSLDKHHQTAMQLMLGSDIPPIYTFYGNGSNSSGSRTGNAAAMSDSGEPRTWND